MKTVGEILKAERIKQSKTHNEVHEFTKLPIKTILAIEADKFNILPGATFTKGFIKVYAHYLNLDYRSLLAIYRRDWQEKRSKAILPANFTDPFNEKAVIWTPKFGFLILIGLVFISLFAYIIVQLNQFFKPPKLVLTEPVENQQINKNEVLVRGITNPEVSVYVNDQLINIDDKGQFSYVVHLLPNENTIVVLAQDRKGKKTSIIRKISVSGINPG